MEFVCPDDIAEYGEGNESGRIRARLIRAENIYQMPAVYKCPFLSSMKLSYSYMEQLQTADYALLKNNFETDMLSVLYKFFPQIKGTIIASEVSTPLSTENFTNYKNGEIYGLAHSPERFTLPFLRPKTPIRGLFLTGQDITLVGVSGAMLSGLLCATTILKFNSWKIFKEIKDSKL